MRTVRAIAIDDNVSSLNIIEALSGKLDFISLERKFTDPITAGNYLAKESGIDLIFLDVQMPEMDGITFLKTYRPRQHIIFITKHREYAVDSYDLENTLGIRVIDYLPIPVTMERFIRACNKVMEILNQEGQFIFLNENRVEIKIPFDDIVLI